MIAAGAKKNENRNDRRNDRAKMIAAALETDRTEMIAACAENRQNSNSEGASNPGFGLCLEFLSALSSYYGY